MATYEEFTIDQGTDVAIELHLVDQAQAAKDLTNYSVAAKLKKTYNSDSDDTTNFTAIVSDVRDHFKINNLIFGCKKQKYTHVSSTFTKIKGLRNFGSHCIYSLARSSAFIPFGKSAL